MKRPLALEALYSSSHYDCHHSPSSVDEAMRRAPERLRKFDPKGDNAKALLNEIASQRTS